MSCVDSMFLLHAGIYLAKDKCRIVWERAQEWSTPGCVEWKFIEDLHLCSRVMSVNRLNS